MCIVTKSLLENIGIDEQHLPLTWRPATALSLFECSNLRRLAVDMMDGSNISDLVAILDACPGLKYLSYISRKRNPNNINTQLLKYTQIPTTTDIECLAISNQFHPADFMIILRRCPYLRYLDVHGNGLTKIHLNAIIDACPLLESLQHSTRHRLNIQNTRLQEWWHHFCQRRYTRRRSIQDDDSLRELVLKQASEGTLFYQAGPTITRHYDSLRCIKLSQRATLCSKNTAKQSVIPQRVATTPTHLEELEYDFPGPVSTLYQHSSLLIPLLQARKSLVNVSIGLSTPLSSQGLDALARCEKLRKLCIRVPNSAKDMERLFVAIARYGHPLETLDYSCPTTTTPLSPALTSALAKVPTLRHVHLSRPKQNVEPITDFDTGSSLSCLCRSNSIQSLTLSHIPFDYSCNRVWQYISGISSLKSLSIITSEKIYNGEGIKWIADRQQPLEHFSLTGVWDYSGVVKDALEHANRKISTTHYNNMNKDDSDSEDEDNYHNHYHF